MPGQETLAWHPAYGTFKTRIGKMNRLMRRT
jgi:hypothetical protein